MINPRILVVLIVLVVASPVSARASDKLSNPEAERILKKGVMFFRQHVSASGGYLWRYSDDLARREGEGRG